MVNDFNYIARMKSARRFPTFFLFFLCLACEGYFAFFIIRDKLFRITNLIVAIVLIYMLCAVFQTYLRKKTFRFVWFAGFQTLYWLICDYVLATMLGHFPHDWLNNLFMEQNVVIIQIVFVIIVLFLDAILIPLASILFKNAQRKLQKDENRAHISYGRAFISAFAGVISARVVNQLANVIPNIVVSRVISSVSSILVLLMIGCVGWLILFYAKKQPYDIFDSETFSVQPVDFL